MTTNPFTFGNPIRDPARFYGRKQEIRQIVNRLLSSARESTSIVGERRIGKTSLLYYLANPQVAAGLGLAPDKFCLVYIDFQGLTDITPQRFWQRVLGKMGRGFCDAKLIPTIDQLARQDKFDLFDLEDLFEQIKDAGISVVLLMDEFEYVTQNPNFGADFFGGLRALAIHYPLALIPATRRELVDLCHSAEIKGSPFFNIFANVVLRPLTRDEASELIDGYVADAGLEFTLQEKEFILKLGGGHPHFIQIAGYYLFEGKAQGLAGTMLSTRVADEADQQGDPHFSYLWSHCSESEKITLLAVLTLGRQKPSDKTIPHLANLTRVHSRANLDVPTLVKRGLLIETDHTYALLSPGLERWIAREIVAAPGEEESQRTAEEWLKSGGRDTLTPVKGVLPRFKKKYWHLMNDLMKEVSLEVVATVALETAKVILI